MAKIIKAGETSNSELTKKVTLILRSGGVVVLPTDTAYALCVDALNKSALNKLLKLKRERAGKPIHVICDSTSLAKKLVYFNKEAEILAEKFLPGPLTLILPQKIKTEKELTGKLKTLGIRIPDQKLVLEVVKNLKKPITATSANPSGGKTPYSVKDILAQYSQKELNLIDLIVDARKLPITLPSTLVNLSTSPYKILREGPIKKAEIENALNL